MRPFGLPGIRRRTHTRPAASVKLDDSRYTSGYPSSVATCVRAIRREPASGRWRIGTSSIGLAEVVNVRSFDRTTSRGEGGTGADGCGDGCGAVAPVDGPALCGDGSGVDAAFACAPNANDWAAQAMPAAKSRCRLPAFMTGQAGPVRVRLTGEPGVDWTAVEDDDAQRLRFGLAARGEDNHHLDAVHTESDPSRVDLEAIAPAPVSVGDGLDLVPV